MMSRVAAAFCVVFLSSICVQAFVPSKIFSLATLKSSSTRQFLSTADFKNGMTLEVDGVPVRMIEFLHVKPGKGSAFVRTKIKNLINGSTQERTFRAGESVGSAEVSKTAMQYTFTEGENLVFMDMETFEEVRIIIKKVDNVLLLKPGLECKVSVWNDQVIDVELPISVEYIVIDTPPNFKGNSAAGGTKPAIVEGGASINVPMFIENGQLIEISTADLKYLGKAGGVNRN